MARLILLFCFFICLKPCHAQYFDTLHIHYDIGVAGLQQKDKATLDILAKDIGSRKILIYSYADYLGSERPNQHLSDNRANEVKSYLLKKGISQSQVMECTGLGMVKGSGSNEGDVTFRRTDIFIRKESNLVVKENKNQTIRSPKQIVSEKVEGEKPGSTHIGKTTDQELLLRIAGKRGMPQGEVTKIDLDTLKVDETLNLKNIMFITGRADILTPSYAEVDNLYNVMYDNPTLKIRLEGHVCCCVYPDGFFDDTPTWGLSVERARRIYEHLIARGIAAERMEYKGFGRTRPIRENEKTEEEGAVNRRVEIRILAK